MAPFRETQIHTIKPYLWQHHGVPYYQAQNKTQYKSYTNTQNMNTQILKNTHTKAQLSKTRFNAMFVSINQNSSKPYLIFFLFHLTC